MNYRRRLALAAALLASLFAGWVQGRDLAAIHQLFHNNFPIVARREINCGSKRSFVGHF